MKKRPHLGSTIAFVVGILSLISGIAYSGSGLIGGPIIILGAWAYRSAKRRKLAEVKPTSLQIIFELLAIVAILAIVGLQNNLKQQIVADPTTNILIPLWAIVAYLIIIFKKGRK